MERARIRSSIYRVLSMQVEHVRAAYLRILALPEPCRLRQKRMLRPTQWALIWVPRTPVLETPAGIFAASRIGP